MDMKILLSLMVVGIAALGVGMGTMAYFSDTETSNGNTFTAGTLDLTLGESGGAPISLTNMAPGDTASGTITVTNDGSLAGWLGAKSSYVEADISGGADPNVGPHNTAKMLVITAFTADSFDMLAANKIPDVDGDSKITVYDMVNDPSAGPAPHASGNWYSYDEDMQPNDVHVYSMTVKFDETAGNDYQGDGIVWTFEFLLDQKA